MNDPIPIEDIVRNVAKCSDHPYITERVCDLLRQQAARLEELEAELLRCRTTETASAHALDVIRQLCGLPLIPSEHPSDTGKRISGRIKELEAALVKISFDLTAALIASDEQQRDEIVVRAKQRIVEARKEGES